MKLQHRAAALWTAPSLPLLEPGGLFSPWLCSNWEGPCLSFQGSLGCRLLDEVVTSCLVLRKIPRHCDLVSTATAPVLVRTWVRA